MFLVFKKIFKHLFQFYLLINIKYCYLERLNNRFIDYFRNETDSSKFVISNLIKYNKK